MSPPILIEYCCLCGYEQRAQELASGLRAAFGVEVELKRAGSGAFEVYLGSELLFSKKKSGRFPTEREIAGAIDAALLEE